MVHCPSDIPAEPKRLVINCEGCNVIIITAPAQCLAFPLEEHPVGDRLETILRS